MKKKVFCVMALCMGLFSSCDKDDIVFEEPIVPPIEEPEKPSVIPSTDDLIRIKIDDDIMAIVGNGMWRSICYGNGRYVAVGDSVRTESNGLNGRWGCNLLYQWRKLVNTNIFSQGFWGRCIY